mgnify:CR=1 FL=1
MRHCKTPRSRRGFTLIEMLIVVAIIAILVAISIPLVSSSLEKARVATDQANERAAKAAAVIYLLTDEGYDWNDTGGQSLLYDAESGQLIPVTPNTPLITPYGQSKNNRGKIIQVNFLDKTDNRFTITWDEQSQPSHP